MRNIEGDNCPKCAGAGGIWYGSTSTWRGGMGGASYTWDVCDLCWGSGDTERPWTDLRKLEAEEATRVRDKAANLFADRCGAYLKSLHPAIGQVAEYLETLTRKRKIDPSTALVAKQLALLLTSISRVV